MEQPTLETSRLVLRPFRNDDAANVRRLAGDWSVADTTLNVPHPYPEGAAGDWIASHSVALEAGTRMTFAIESRPPVHESLVGTVGLLLNRTRDVGEVVYWLGAEFRNRGYCTEAARAVIEYAFTALELHRIHAGHFARNPASGRVLAKLGMLQEGVLRQHVKKWERYEDLVVYGLLRDEWLRHRGSPT
ncbi:MAG: GNAT family N-acetyltransferase [Mycobacterium sp.]